MVSANNRCTLLDKLNNGIKVIVIISILVIAFCPPTYSNSFNVEIGTDMNAAFTLEGDIGICFKDYDFLYCGVKTQIYKLSNREDNSWNTSSIFNNLLLSGFRYRVPVYKNKKNSTIGFHTDIKGYLNPYVPKKLKYTDTTDVGKIAYGKYDYQLGYGIGFGFYILPEDSDGYVSIKFELTNIDAFKTLRQFKDYYTFPEHYLLALSISLFQW